MGAWQTRGLRGSVLEDCINFTNDYYRQHKLAVIQKIPTPITPVEMNKESSTITLAYFDKQSTVDYIGAVQGIPICFDAKEAAQKRLPLQNIHFHQIEFMEDFSKQGGISFLLVNFTGENEFFLLPLEVLKKYWEDAQNGGRKSIPYDAFEQRYKIKNANGAMLNYLEAVNEYLKEKN
ncbi:Holliday junction resolvase RecU [bioreactor metagenome]|uniref:Holliday junction resolvase RecU n=1 Tax=bioreactor metagenome TaxID=1076179 RepID=A0A644YDN7_9ZZZZ|nr:Holliday junction resolvase RecU [Candidatus Metalachnospira sp.]